MRHRLLIVFGAAVGLVAATVSSSAHHTGSTVLSDTTVTHTGVVKSWLWSNPHCLLRIEVKGADGQVVEWVMETQAPNSIYGEGYRKNSFKPGDQVSVTVNPVANGGPYGRIASVVLADGTSSAGMGFAAAARHRNRSQLGENNEPTRQETTKTRRHVF